VFATTPSALIEPEGRLHAFCHAVPGMWHFMGVMLSAAGSLQWYRDTLAPTMSFDDLLQEAEIVPAGSEGLQFLPYLVGNTYPDPLARALCWPHALLANDPRSSALWFERQLYLDSECGIGRHHTSPRLRRRDERGVVETDPRICSGWLVTLTTKAEPTARLLEEQGRCGMCRAPESAIRSPQHNPDPG
jgi:hypothetical protein